MTTIRPILLGVFCLFLTISTANAKCYNAPQWPESWPNGEVSWFHVNEDAKRLLDDRGVLLEPFGRDATEIVLDRVDGRDQKLVLKANEVSCADVIKGGHRGDVEVRVEYQDGRHRVFWINPASPMTDSFYTPSFH